MFTRIVTPELPTADRHRLSGRRWLIAALGALAAVFAVLFVLAPVQQDTTTYQWNGDQNTALPLFPDQPARMDVTLDSAKLAGKPDSLVLSTVPPANLAGAQNSPPGLDIWLTGGQLRVLIGGVPAAQAPANGAWHVSTDGTGSTVSVDGNTIGQVAARPHVAGLFTDLPGSAPRVSVTGDTRFDTAPTGWKIAAGALAAVSVLALLLVLRVPRPVRFLPRAWWRPTPLDLTLTAVLGLWAIIGALTVDDGYIITMLKSANDTGFTGNFFRWFNAPEAPFGWFYEIYRPLAELAGGGVWLRLPSVLFGILSWFVVDRVLLPRITLGRRKWTRWIAAAAFLTSYLPFNVGLRPEPWIVLGALVVFALVERGLALATLVPLAVGIVLAGATVAVTPTGVVAFLPFLAAARPIWRVVRRTRIGWLPAIAAILGTGASALLFMFYDQSLANVFASTDIRTAIGPSMNWTQELGRYETLLNPEVVEGALNRRIPVLLMLFSMLVLTVLLIVRRHPGVRAATARRLLLTTALFLVALAFTPTKWTHHFGALAGFGALLIAILAHTINRGALRANWARLLVLAGLVGVVSLAIAAPNRWWNVSGLNVKWAEDAPSVAGIPASYLVLGLGVLLLGFAWLRRQPLSGTVLAVVALSTVAMEVGTMAYGVQVRAHTYSLGKAHLAQLTSHGCGLDDWVWLEPDTNAGRVAERDGWYQLPPEAASNDVTPLVLPVTGVGTATLEFADSAGKVLRQLPIKRRAQDAIHEARFDVGEAPGATQARVTGNSGLTLGPARLPRLVPLTDIVPTTERVVLDWPNAFAMPCRKPPSLAEAKTEPVRYRIGPGPDSVDLASLSYSTEAGGPYTPLLELAKPTEIPAYLRGDKYYQPVTVYRLDYPTPMRGLEISHGTESRGAVTTSPPLTP